VRRTAGTGRRPGAMYEVYKEKSFSGAHHLRGYEGKCEAVHGHNWKVRAFVGASQLDSLGMVVDFKKLKQALGEVSDILDHKDLNATPPFDEINPSAENIAKFLFDELSGRLNDERVRVTAVSVWESERACATYRP